MPQKKRAPKLYEEYMRDKVQEYRHREVLAYLIINMGIVFLVGGLLIAVTLAENLSWLLIFPYEPNSYTASFVGTILCVFGFVLISGGFVLAFHYDREKMWFSKKLKESNVLVEELLSKGKKNY
ncbi:MAG: hypothetical protein JSV15_06955 [Candidatus Bathyarchaeota archaeon]|nr:MAG: hypothetical protein JSV15_06955 [Candidatus Bathyarchaeota archaeon]